MKYQCEDCKRQFQTESTDQRPLYCPWCRTATLRQEGEARETPGEAARRGFYSDESQSLKPKNS